MRQVCENMPGIVSALKLLRTGSRARVSVAYRRVVLCFLSLGLLCGSTQSLRAQQTSKPTKLPSAEKIVDSYLKAIGGKKRIATIRDATYEWEIRLKDRPMGIARTAAKTPASVRSELIFGNGEIVSAATPRSAWLRGLDGKLHALTDAEAAAARLQALLDASHLVDIKKHNVLSQVVSFAVAQAQPVYALEFSLRSGARLRYLFSLATKLLIGIEDEARKSTTRFEDYRAEGNILEPHRVNIDNGGTGELTFLLQHVKYNTGIPDSTFDPPQTVEAASPWSAPARRRFGPPRSVAARQVRLRSEIRVEPTVTLWRQAAGGQSGDRSPHSRELQSGLELDSPSR